MSGGGGSSRSYNMPAPETRKVIGESWKIAKPAVQLVTNQAIEALTTGGIGARMPIINKAVESTRSATSKALTSITEGLARTKQLKTPFGQRTLAENVLSGELTSARLPSEMTMNFLQQIIGFLTGSQQVAGTPLNLSKSTSSQAQGGINCCFIFAAAHGSIHPIVRRYRDENTSLRTKRGYYWLSDRLVPKMRASARFTRLIRILMTTPMTSYGKFHYGLGKIGLIFVPITALWLLTFRILGHRPPYRRHNSDIIV